jgi:hypothetical protein
MRLMGVSLNDLGIGVKLAQDIIKAYGTVYNFMCCDPREAAARIRGISEQGVRTWQRQMGRPDV